MSRSTILSLAWILVLLVGGCARDPVRPYEGEPTPPPLGAPDIDVTPEWSYDGSTVAYHRRFASTEGPPGIYVIPSTGGVSRFLAETDFWTPTTIRFSPDDRYLACDRGSQLLIIEINTGALIEPLYTTNGVAEPDWSPDGRTIAYRRVPAFNVPPESLGVHLFDLQTGIDRPLIYRGDIVIGTSPVWTAGGEALAVIHRLGDRSYVNLIELDGSDVRTIVTSPLDRSLLNLHRHTDRLWGSGLVFSGVIESGSGTFFVRWDGSALQRVPRTYRGYYGYSSDGHWSVGSRFDPTDSLAVLFVCSTSDLTGASCRQLTHYTPPAGGVRRFVLLGR